MNASERKILEEVARRWSSYIGVKISPTTVMILNLMQNSVRQDHAEMCHEKDALPYADVKAALDKSRKPDVRIGMKTIPPSDLLLQLVGCGCGGRHRVLPDGTILVCKRDREGLRAHWDDKISIVT